MVIVAGLLQNSNWKEFKKPVDETRKRKSRMMADDVHGDGSVVEVRENRWRRVVGVSG